MQAPALDPSALISVGDPSLDQQHRQLLDLGHRAVSELGETLDQRAHGLLNELVLTIERHFGFEEALLQQHGYPGLSAHRELHDAVREQLAILLLDAASGTATPADIAAFVLAWVEDHVSTADADYRDCLAAASAPPVGTRQPSAPPRPLTRPGAHR